MEDSQQRNYKLNYLAAFLVAGMLTDFIFVGILKVIWIVIFTPAYLAFAMTLETALRRNPKYREYAKSSVVAYLVGCLLAHLIFVNHVRHDHYSMTLVSSDPIILKSSQFPEYLYVTSPNVTQALKNDHLEKDIDMETESVTDYDCMKTFVINKVDEQDVKSDKASTWTLRFNKIGVFSTTILPSMDDNTWPWCKISFYRT